MVKKQEVTNRTLNIGNISNASNNDNLNKNEKRSSKNLVPVKFKVSKDLVNKFHSLKIMYAKKKQVFNLSNNVMFSIMISFLYSKYKSDNILENCPDEFKEAIIKPGKRKTTSRTVSFENSDIILFKIEEDLADKYMDIMFSYIKQDKNDSVFSTHHSRTYFFYDFIDTLEKNKKDFLKYSID